MEPMTIGIIGVIALLFFLAIGVHIGGALLMVGFIGILLITNLNSAVQLVAHSFYTTASSYGFTVLPLFIIMGSFATVSGITGKAYDFAVKWFSNLRGGLYIVTTSACALFAACTGSSTSTVAAIGKAVLPEMEKYGYDRSLSLGCIAVCGTLGVMIPPSIPLVMYGIITEEPVGRLLLAGVVPGVLTAVIYMLGTSVLVRLRPHLGPSATKYSWKQRLQALPNIWGVIVLFGVVMIGLYTGIFTPTEAGAWGAFAAIVLAIMATKRGFFRKLKSISMETMVMTGMIFFIFMTAIVFTRFLTFAGMVDAMMSFISEKGFSPYSVLALFIIVSIILGMFISAGAVVILVAPLAHRALVPLGFNPIWLGIIMVKMFELAVVTPPVATNLYVARSLSPDATIGQVTRGIIPFVVMEFISISIIVAFPEIALWLPNMAFG